MNQTQVTFRYYRLWPFRVWIVLIGKLPYLLYLNRHGDAVLK